MKRGNRKILRASLVVAWVALLGISLASAQVDPWVMVKRMGRGINLGNTLDAPEEGRWAAPAQEFYFDDYRDAGFTCVRIPITWDLHLGTEPPYTIDAAWLDRVEQVVDWALARGLVTVINAHNEAWLYDNFSANLPRFESLWRQVAERFKDKPDELLFEIINEPYFDLSEAQVDTLNARILRIIRQTNPHRIVLLTGGGQNSYRAPLHLHPPDDPYLMAYFHYYLPWRFTHDRIGTWGTAQDKAVVDGHFDLVRNWSAQHGLPIFLGEFGVSVGADRPSLLRWYDYVANGAIRRGFAFAVWDAGPSANKYTYLRQPGLWDEAQLNVLTDQRPFTGDPWPVPGRIEAEAFDTGAPGVAYGDEDTVNTFGAFRSHQGVEIDSLPDGGYAVVLDEPGNWTEYTFDPDTAGVYAVSVRVRARSGDATVALRFNGHRYAGPFGSLPEGDFGVVSDSLFLSEGTHVVRLLSETGGVQVDWIQFTLRSPAQTNLLKNSGFELGLEDWQVKQCTATTVDTPVHSGRRALLLSSRTKEWAGVYQNVRQALLANGPGYYRVQGWLRAVADTGWARVKMRLTYGGRQHHLGVPVKIDTTDWTLACDTLLLTWDGTLENANFFVQGARGYLGDFLADDVLLRFLGPASSVASERSARLPQDWALANYPNPFNSATAIAFRVPAAGRVVLEVVDLRGVVVRRLVNRVLPPGSHRVVWDGRNQAGLPAASGCYLAVLRENGMRKVRKMLLLR